jgi:hypothetical protein
MRHPPLKRGCMSAMLVPAGVCQSPRRYFERWNHGLTSYWSWSHAKPSAVNRPLVYAGVLHLKSVTYYGCLTWIYCIVGTGSGSRWDQCALSIPLPARRRC